MGYFKFIGTPKPNLKFKRQQGERSNRRSGNFTLSVERSLELHGNEAPTLLHVVWEFEVRTDCREQFERCYGPYGDWAMLFRKSPFYDRTILTRDPKAPSRYLLTDIWIDLGSYESFKRNFKDAYEALDKACEQFTVKEQLIGCFEQIESKEPRLSAGESEAGRTK